MTIPLSHRPGLTKAPLSDAQQRLWFLHRLNGGSPDYNMSVPMRFTGNFDVTAFRRAISAVVERHAVLRTRFVDADGEPCQVIDHNASIDVRVDDLSHFDEELLGDRIASRQRIDASEPFDLERGPLLRMRILRLGPSEHIVLRTVHHIIWDAWCEGIFHRELAAFYNAFVEGTQPDLPALPVQFADFAMWQHETREIARIRTGLEYWKRQLHDSPERLDWPTDRVRSHIRASVAHAHTVTMTDARYDRIAALARSHRVTVYVVLLAAYAALLARYAGQDDIVIASPVTSRRDVRLETLIGFFANSIPMRVRVRPTETISALIQTARHTVLQAFHHQDVPFERIVAAVAPTRSLAVLPICQVLLGLQNVPSTVPRFTGLEVTRVEERDYSIRYDLELHVTAREGERRLLWLSNPNRFDAVRVERMALHFGEILDAMTGDAAARVASIELSAAEASRPLDDEGPARQRPTFPTMIEAQAARTPSASAVVCGDVVLTYQELNARANQCAHVLIRRGVGPEHIVGVFIERSCDMVATILGILKSGAAFLPLTADLPPQRLAAIVDAADPRLVLTDRASTPLVGTGNRLVALRSPEVQSELADAPIDNPQDRDRMCALSPEHPAYVMFTSGSTGSPKGVVIEHQALSAFLDAMTRECPFAPGDRHVAVSTITFDISVLELFMPLCHGASVVIAESDVVRDPRRLASLVERHTATSLQATPSHWSVLCHRVAGLRTALVGGEALASDIARDMRATATAVLNVYGPTEATIWASAHRLTEDDTGADCAPVVPIGRPLAEYVMYVLDGTYRRVPEGVVGELYIAGAGLARGYLKRPTWTAERFLPDPFGPAGSRMYRTGDLARQRADGTLEFMGRSDQQVKIRGFRIELGEIETALRSHGSVQDAAVIVHGSGELKRLAAYVILRSFDGDLVETLQCHLRDRLPEYMVPATITALDQWPLNPSGKLDRKALPLPAASASAATPRTAPTTEEEKAVAALFADLLALDDVGVDDDFFHRGGHSMLAMRLINRVRSFLGIELSIGEFFEARTVRSVAKRIGERAADVPRLVPSDIRSSANSGSVATVTSHGT